MELLVAVIFVGIISAIAAPSFIGLFARNQVIDAMGSIKGALKEAQRQAKKIGQTCTVTFNDSTKAITGAPNSCLLSDRLLDDRINISATGRTSPFDISFSYKGTTTDATTIIVTGNNTALQRCLSISNGVGIMRIGNYVGSNCEKLD